MDGDLAELLTKLVESDRALETARLQLEKEWGIAVTTAAYDLQELVDVNDLKAGVAALITIVFLNWRGQGLK